jgi:hypothetical protein
MLGSVVSATAKGSGKAVELPWSALTKNISEPAVWMVDDKGEAQLHNVTVSRYLTGKVIISDGLKAGKSHCRRRAVAAPRHESRDRRKHLQGSATGSTAMKRLGLLSIGCCWPPARKGAAAGAGTAGAVDQGQALNEETSAFRRQHSGALREQHRLSRRWTHRQP